MLSKYALYLGLLFYSVAVTICLVLFNAPFITSLLLLYVVPIVWWWHELFPPKSFLYGVMWLATCTTILFESIAHVSGAWYSVGEGVFRLFGLIPLESFLLTFVQFVYLVLLHEFFVDDKRLHSVRFDRRRSRLFWLLTSLLIIGLFQATVFAEFFLSYAFMGMIGLVLTPIAAVSHRASKSFEKHTYSCLSSNFYFV